VKTLQQFVFIFEQLPLQLNPYNQSMNRFNQDFNTGIKVSFNEILMFTCSYIKWVHRKKCWFKTHVLLLSHHYLNYSFKVALVFKTLVRNGIVAILYSTLHILQRISSTF